jgi:hypothetical protein
MIRAVETPKIGGQASRVQTEVHHRIIVSGMKGKVNKKNLRELKHICQGFGLAASVSY